MAGDDDQHHVDHDHHDETEEKNKKNNKIVRAKIKPKSKKTRIDIDHDETEEINNIGIAPPKPPQNLKPHRNCSSSTASKSADIPSVDDSVEEAAITLMLLAHHDHHVSLKSTINDQINNNKEEVEGKFANRDKSGGGQYICRDCKISFPSYEALGGHTSTHNKKNVNITRSSTSFVDLSRSADATDDKDGGDGGRKIVFYFDLNELPPSED